MQIVDTARELAIPPVFRLGFRPFFLAGALFALIAVPLWMLALAGFIPAWQPAGGWLAWHRHEMLFGFGSAIVAGFLLTAVQNWTERPGLRGAPLAALAGLWLAARLGWLFALPSALLLPLELAFLPLVALVMARMLFAVRQVRNYPVVVMLLLMTAANAIVMTGLVQGDDALQRRGAMAGIWVIVTLLGLIGGRVIPFFTMRGLALKKTVALPWMDWVVLVGGMAMVLLTAFGLAEQPHAAIAVFCFQLAAGHLIRLAHWYEHGIWKVPLLWSLHLAYAWLVVATAGLGFWHAGLIETLSLPLHALTIGAMSGAILAMIARVTLGHTGRELKPPQAMTLAFILLNLGMLARTLLVVVLPMAGLVAAAACWSLAFAIFLWHYAPMLARARVDGRPG